MNEKTASLSELSRWFKMDRRKLSRALSEAGIVPTKEGAAHLYPLPEAAKIAFEAKIQTEQTSADRRNHAQAEKLELETAKLRAAHIPIDRGVWIVSRVLYLLAEIVQSSELSQEAQGRFVSRIREEIPRLRQTLRQEIEEDETDERFGDAI